MERRFGRVFPDMEAVHEVVGAEPMYLYTLGSNQANAHVYWHVVPLAPGGLTSSSRGHGLVGMTES